MISIRSFNVTTTGTAGTAVGSIGFGTGPFKLIAARVSDSLPATGDVTLMNMGRTFILSTNVAGPRVTYPRAIAQIASSGADIAAGDGGRYAAPVIAGSAYINVAQADAGTVVVDLYFEA